MLMCMLEAQIQGEPMVSRAVLKPNNGYQKNFKKKATRVSFGQAFRNFVSDLWAGAILAAVLFVAGMGALYGLRTLGFQSDVVALKHVVSAADCSIAYMVDMAPSKFDQPGYWMHLDADKDGTACEEGR